MNEFARERLERQRELLATAAMYADLVCERFGPATVLLYGSVARGDFNAWSDVDVLVISDNLPESPLERSKALHEIAYPGVEPKGYLRSEYEEAHRRGDPFIRHLLTYCVALRDDLGLLGPGCP